MKGHQPVKNLHHLFSEHNFKKISGAAGCMTWLTWKIFVSWCV